MNKLIIVFFLIILACGQPSVESSVNIQDTWRLISGVKINGTDTTFTDYTKDQKVLKIINDTHFSFIRHDLNKGTDSTNTVFVAGAGTYQLEGNQYREHLEFCSYRPWEEHDFEFQIRVVGDTLIQTGVEKIEELGVDQIITETYIRD